MDAKDVWIADNEKIVEQVGDRQLTIKEGIDQLVHRGFTYTEAASMVLEAAGGECPDCEGVPKDPACPECGGQTNTATKESS